MFRPHLLMHDGHNLAAEWSRRCVVLKGLNQPTYPLQIPHALPSSGPHLRPCLLFLKCSQFSLCRTFDDVLSQICVDGSLLPKTSVVKWLAVRRIAAFGHVRDLCAVSKVKAFSNRGGDFYMNVICGNISRVNHN